MNIQNKFKLGVVSFILLFMGAVYISLAGGTNRLDVEVQPPIPHKPVQEYEVE